MSLTPEAEADLVEAIYAAPLQENGWRPVLRRVQSATRSASMALFGPTAGAPEVTSSLYFMEGLDEDFIARNADDYLDQDPIIHALRDGKACLDSVIQAHSVVSKSEMRPLAFYNDYMKPLGFDDALSVFLTPPNADTGGTVFSLYGQPGETFDGEALSMVERLSPHLRRAMRFSLWRPISLGRADLTSSVLANLAIPCALIDEDGLIIHANPAMERYCANAYAPIRLRRGRIKAVQTRSNDALAAAIFRATSATNRVGTEVPLPCRDGATGLLTITPLGDDNPFDDAARTARAVVFVMDPTRDLGSREVGLRRLSAMHGLSVAEGGIALDLIQGLSPDEIALESGRSIETVRSHIRAILSKTGLSRYSQLGSLNALFLVAGDA